MKQITLTLCFIVLSIFIQASLPENIQNLNFNQKMRYASSVYELGNYIEAAEIYQVLIKERENHAEAMFMLAQSFRKARDYEKAEKAYKKLLDEHANRYPEARFYYARMLKSNTRYAEAKRQFNEFKSIASGRQFKDYLTLAEMEIKACDFAIAEASVDISELDLTITHLGSSLNSQQTDYAPTYHGGKLYFASFNTDSLRKGPYHTRGSYFSHIYTSTLVSEGTFDAPEIVRAPINGSDFHSGNGVFSIDGKRFYFTKCTDFGNANIECAIYVSTFQNNQFGEAVKLNQQVNKPGSSNTQPALGLNDDGKDILYFSSNRNGGIGGFDIWYSIIESGSHAGTAVNLGTTVNTVGNERTPFYDQRRGILYFSSDGHPGLGGADIFKVNGSKTNWELVVNMGFPINSPADDMYFSIGEAPNIFYLSSNREGNLGAYGKTCCDDLYRVVGALIPDFYLSAIVKEEKPDGERIEISNVQVQLIDVTNESDRKVINEQSSSNRDLFYKIEHDKRYQLTFRKDDYFTESHFVDTRRLTESDTFKLEVAMRKIEVGQTYTLSNVYYDFGKAVLRAESKETLVELYQLLVDNPNIIIEISSHTDHVGTDEANLKLSQERAQACVNFLLEKGISESQLKARGYGKSRPVAPNLNPNGTRNEEGMQRNRRTEFEVIGDLDGGAEVIYE